MLDVAPGVERGLEIDSADGGVLDGKVDDLADFMLVDAALNSGYERNVQADLSKAIEGSELLFQNVRLAAQDAVGFRVKTIELEVKRWPDLVQLFKKSIVLRNSFSVCVDHHRIDTTRLCRTNEIDDQWVDGWFAARELNNFRGAFSSNEVVEHLFDFFHG